jgi:hypothetical protein
MNLKFLEKLLTFLLAAGKRLLTSDKPILPTKLKVDPYFFNNENLPFLPFFGSLGSGSNEKGQESRAKICNQNVYYSITLFSVRLSGVEAY